MPKILKFRRGTNEETPTDLQDGELFIDKDNNEVVVGNDSAVGSKFKVENIEKSRAMTETEYRALQEMRKKQYAGSGFVDVSKKYFRLFYINDGGLAVWKKNDPYFGKDNLQGSALYLGDETNPNYEKPVYNVNGSLIKLAPNGRYFGEIRLPEPPTSKATITDSTNLPVDMKQGDLVILKDLDRELVVNGDFSDNDISMFVQDTGGQLVIEYDEENERLKITRDSNDYNHDVYQYLELINGVKYEVNPGDFDPEKVVIIITENGSNSLYMNEPNKVYYYTPTTSNYRIIIRALDGVTGTYYWDNISIKQVSEQPIVALQDITAGSDVYENSTIFEARDYISRQDLVFLEYWEEDISEKDFVYPYGNVQYRGGNVDGLTGITEGTFEGADTYSRFGVWQEPGELIGKGYVWSNLTDEQKVILANNPDHNIFLSKDGRWIQGRYRIRVVKGLGNEWFTPFYLRLQYDNEHRVVPCGKQIYNIEFGLPTVVGLYTGVPIGEADTSLGDYGNESGLGSLIATSYNGTTYVKNDMFGYDGNCYALPIALVQRRNDGIFNKILNPEGTAVAYDKDNDRTLEFGEYALTTDFVTSLEDCFDISKIAATTADGNVVPADDSSAVNRSGYIASGMNGHEAGLYADEINEMDVEDLRMDAKKKPLAEILEEERNKDISGERRGKEKSTGILTVKAITTYNGVYGFTAFDTQTMLNNGIIQDRYGNSISLATVVYYQYPVVGYGLIKGTLYRLEKWINQYHVRVTKNLGNGWVDGSWTELHNYTGEWLFIPARSNLLEDWNGNKLEKTYTFNNAYIQTDILGDPRPLKDRVQYTTASGDDQTATINKNTYVLADGTYYRSLVDRGDITIDPDTEDYSNTDNWVNLGTDGNIGSYPQEWLDNGFAGAPLIVGEEGESLLPVDLIIDDERSPYKLTKKVVKIQKVYVYNNSSKFIEFINDGSAGRNKYTWGLNSVTNEIKINITDSYLDLGYSSEQEMLDLMKVVVIYETKANFMELAYNYDVLTYSNKVICINSRLYNKGTFTCSNLISKVSVNDASGGTAMISNSILVNPNMFIRFDNGTWYGDDPVHGEFNKMVTAYNPAVKFFNYLIQQNNRLYLQYVFKELKYDTNSSTWGDDNKFQIVDKVSTVTDLNGNTVLYGQKRVALPYFYTGE